MENQRKDYSQKQAEQKNEINKMSENKYQMIEEKFKEFKHNSDNFQEYVESKFQKKNKEKSDFMLEFSNI